MKKIDFSKFYLFKGIKREKQEDAADIREVFGDIIYSSVNGIKGVTLATKVFKSEGPTEFTDEEVNIFMKLADEKCTAAFYDSLESSIVEDK